MFKTNDIKKRKSKNLHDKCWAVFILLVIIIALYFLNPDFSSSIYNGIMLFLISILISVIAYNEEYYIQTGLQPRDVAHKEKYELFLKMNPSVAIKNRLVFWVYFISLITSIVMIIKGLMAFL